MSPSVFAGPQKTWKKELLSRSFDDLVCVDLPYILASQKQTALLCWIDCMFHPHSVLFEKNAPSIAKEIKNHSAWPAAKWEAVAVYLLSPLRKNSHMDPFASIHRKHVAFLGAWLYHAPHDLGILKKRDADEKIFYLAALLNSFAAYSPLGVKWVLKNSPDQKKICEIALKNHYKKSLSEIKRFFAFTGVNSFPLFDQETKILLPEYCDKRLDMFLKKVLEWGGVKVDLKQKILGAMENFVLSKMSIGSASASLPLPPDRLGAWADETIAKTSPSLTDPNWRAIEKVFSIYQKKDPKILDFAPFVRARLNKKALNEVVASVQDAKKDQPKRKM